MTEVPMVRAGVVETAYERRGDPDGWPVVVLHGFPYDVRCYDDVASRLAAEGADVVVPYPRGHGPTRFVDDTTSRSGQQAALAHDLRELATHWGCGRRWWPATTGAAGPPARSPRRGRTGSGVW